MLHFKGLSIQKIPLLSQWGDQGWFHSAGTETETLLAACVIPGDAAQVKSEWINSYLKGTRMQKLFLTNKKWPFYTSAFVQVKQTWYKHVKWAIYRQNRASCFPLILSSLDCNLRLKRWHWYPSEHVRKTANTFMLCLSSTVTDL